MNAEVLVVQEGRELRVFLKPKGPEEEKEKKEFAKKVSEFEGARVEMGYRGNIIILRK